MSARARRAITLNTAMPQENTKRRDVLAAIASISAIAELTGKHNDHYEHELDLEVIVYGRNYNGKQVGPYVRLLNYAPGEVIVREGDWGGNTFYTVVAGAAEVWVKGEKGQTKVSEIPAGTQFGELSVLAGVPRAATVRAPVEQAIQILEIQRPALRLLRKLPKFAETIDATYRRFGRAALLQEINAVTQLGPDAIKQLESISKFRVFAKNHVLFRAGERIDRVYVLRAGWARLSPPGATTGGDMVDAVQAGGQRNGQQLRQAWKQKADDVYIGPSHCLGLEAITHDGDWAYGCTFLERAEVLEISVTKLRRHPELRETLLLAFDGIAVPSELEPARKPVPVARAQEDLIETGLVDATNLLVMDMDLCVRCGNCSLACHKVHGQSRLVRRGIHITRPVKPTAGASFQSLLAPAVCLHCKDPECLTGCPTGAIGRFPDGQVDIHPQTCIGCGDCATQCPYNAISMTTRNSPDGDAAPRPTGLAGWRNLFDLTPDPLPAPVGQTEDLLAIKCNLCAGTPLNPEGVKRQAYSCEENCPTGALLRVDPRSYFAEIKNIQNTTFTESGHALARHTSHKDLGKRIGHGIGLIVTIGLTLLTLTGLANYGLRQPLVGAWLNMRWITGLVGLAGIAGVMAYPVRRQLYRRRAGPLRYWLIAHSYLGVIAGIVLLLHGGTRSGGALTTALMVVFDLVILTGLYGVAAYFVAPRMLTRIEGQPLLLEDLLARRDELRTELGATRAAATNDTRRLIDKKLLPRCLSLAFLLRQYLRHETLEGLIHQIKQEFAPRASQLLATEQRHVTAALEQAVTLRRVDALIYLHKSLKLWLAPHVITTSLMLALLLVHILQVVYFAH